MLVEIGFYVLEHIRYHLIGNEKFSFITLVLLHRTDLVWGGYVEDDVKKANKWRGASIFGKTRHLRVVFDVPALFLNLPIVFISIFSTVLRTGAVASCLMPLKHREIEELCAIMKSFSSTHWFFNSCRPKLRCGNNLTVYELGKYCRTNLACLIIPWVPPLPRQVGMRRYYYCHIFEQKRLNA